MSASTRSPCRSPPARCAPPARRWARCSCAPRTRPTSRSAATARPRCSTPPARWSCRPSTSRCTSARCPPPSPRCRRRDHAPGVVVGPQRPLRAAAPTCPTSRSSRRRSHDGELLGFAASRAHHADVGGRVAGLDARRLDDARRGGRRDRAARARRRGDRRARRADAPARAAPRRPARPARRQPHRRAAPGRAGRPRRRSTACARRRPRCSTTPSGARAPAWPRSPDGTRTRVDVLEARRGRPRAARGRHRRRRRADARLHRLGRAARRQPQLPARGHALSACLFAVRVLTDPDIPPSAGAYRPITVIAPEGSLLNARSPAAVAGGNVETSSRVADLVLGAFGRALGQGTMNNLTLGTDDVHLLRDARRRPGRVPGRRRAERRARRDVEHAQHAGRGARARVPAARDRVRAAPRLGRRRAPPRRRRRRPRARGARPT